jgi:hypothetical protein
MDYSNAKIYKIIDNTNGNVYIGSTRLTLEKRLKRHQYGYKNYLNDKYCFITSFKILANNDYSIELLENYPCESKFALEERERFHIENNKCVNKCVPNRTDKEYYQDNKDIIKERQKQYYQDNQDKIKERHKQYREDNRDAIRERGKQHYHDNKEKLKQNFTCECGGKYQYNDRARHFRTGKHQNYINSLSEINLEK